MSRCEKCGGRLTEVSGQASLAGDQGGSVCMNRACVAFGTEVEPSAQE